MNQNHQQIIDNCYHNIHKKLSPQAKRLYEPRDVKQELHMYFLSSPERMQLDKPEKIAAAVNYFSKAFLHRTHDRMNLEQEYFVQHICADHELASQHNEDEIEVVLVDDQNPETLYEEKQTQERFMQKCSIFKTEIESLCTEFGKPYDKKKPMKCLVTVLDLTLNQYTDEEFKTLPYEKRLRLAELGDAIHIKNLEVKNGPLYHNKGIKALIKEIMQEEGPSCTAKLVREELAKRGYNCKSSTISNLVSQVRKQLNYPKLLQTAGTLREKVRYAMMELGITGIKDMRIWLQDQQVPWKQSTLNQYMSLVRSEMQEKKEGKKC